MRRPKLVIPTQLIVTMLGVPSCDDDGDTDTSGSETSVADTTASETSAPETGSSGFAECADITDEATCTTQTQFECNWNATNMECETNCSAYPDEASCNTEILCVWDDNEGCLGPI